MAVSTLNHAQAFGGGCDLWIIPDKENFTFFSKLDWYINFQLTRAHMHKSESLSPQLKSITNENNLPDFGPSLGNKSALMVSAEMGLPAKSVVEIPFTSPVAWINLVHQTWLNLDRPSLRIFLPNKIATDEFKKSWPGPNNDDVSIVPA